MSGKRRQTARRLKGRVQKQTKRAAKERRVAAMLRVNKCWWRGMLLLMSLSLWLPMRGLAIQTTNVSGIVYRADGSLAQGTILVSWPGFTAADGSAVAAGNTTVTIAFDGSVSMTLAPNAGANPQGTY